MIRYYLVEKVLEFPKSVHKSANYKLIIPIQKEARSLNIVSSVAITLAEALKQNHYL